MGKDFLRGLTSELGAIFSDKIGIVLSDSDFKAFSSKLEKYTSEWACGSKYWDGIVKGDIAMVKINGVEITFMSESELNENIKQ